MAFLSNSMIFLGLSILYFVHPSPAQIVDPHDKEKTIIPLVKLYNAKDLQTPVCDGTIIGEKFVLTAAHCVVSKGKKIAKEEFKVATFNLLGSNEDRKYLSIEDIVIPKDNESSATGNYIAILVLNRTLHLVKDSGWLNLARIYDIDSRVNVGVYVPYSRGKNRTIPLFKQVTQRNSCTKSLNGKVWNDQICGEIDVRPYEEECYNIDGSSLRKDKDVIGIASGSKDCQKSDRLHQSYMFTRVSSFYKGIVEVIRAYTFRPGIVDPHDNELTIYDAVTLFDTKNSQPVCGGTIIGEKYVLTAAHCVVNVSRRYVVTSNPLREKTDTNRNFLRIKAVFIPKNYESAAERNDIAILLLDQTLRLASSSRGWLKLQSSNEIYESPLQIEYANAYNNDPYYCSRPLKEKVRNDQFCVNKYDPQDPEKDCERLGGTGFVYNGTVIGIAGSSKLCEWGGFGYQSHIFTKVSSFYEWIVGVTRGQRS